MSIEANKENSILNTAWGKAMSILAVLSIIIGSVFFFAWLNYVNPDTYAFSCKADKTEAKPVGSFTTFNIKNVFGVEKSLGKALLVEKALEIPASTSTPAEFNVLASSNKKTEKKSEKKAEKKFEKTAAEIEKIETKKAAETEKTETKKAEKTEKIADNTDNTEKTEEKKPQSLKEILECEKCMKSQEAFIAAAKELGIEMVTEKVSDKLTVLYSKGKFESFAKELDVFKAHDFQATYWNAKLANGPFLLLQIADKEESFAY